MDEVSGSAWPVVKDNELLLKVFGRYPSFHDASVLSISMAAGTLGCSMADGG